MNHTTTKMFQAVAKALENNQNTNRGTLIGRNGSIELAAVLAPVQINHETLERHVGIWPRNKILEWRAAYIESIGVCDVIAAGWYKPLASHEDALLNSINPLVTRIALRDLEPYYKSTPNERWTDLLRNRRVTVVSAFAKSMQSQLSKRGDIWGEDNVESLLPTSATFSFVKCGYTPALALSPEAETNWPAQVNTWKEAVDYVVNEVMKTNSDVVLIGCGGLGMVIGHELKKRGKVVIILGGAVQVLFGIKGNRWAQHDVISGFWNEHWIYPSESETPAGAGLVEGSCYWK